MQEDLKVNIKKFSSMKASFEHADIGYCVPSSVIEALLTYNVILQDDEFNDTYISMDQMKLHTFK